jgi:carbonic anhydrase/acetyltransferase-like protein (isoleucine patch superfamily)
MLLVDVEPNLEVKAAAVTGEVTPAKPRKKRAPKHDFKDGCGRVFAHRHINGGGWVADTAVVDDRVEVDKMAQVYHFAKITGNVKIKHRAKVGGTAVLRDSVQILNRAEIFGTARIEEEVVVSNNASVFGGTICGTTQIKENAQIRNKPLIRDSVISGSTSINGYASLFEATCEENVFISGAAFIAHSGLRGYISVGGDARIMYSQLRHSIYLRNDVSEDDQRLKVCEHATICSCEHINGYIAFTGHSNTVNCHIALLAPNNIRLQTDDQAFFAGLRINTPAMFNTYNVPPNARPAMGSQPMQPLNRPVNMSVLSPPRRLMSVSEAPV